MIRNKLFLKFTVLSVLILAAAFSRIVPHMPNFSPLGAIGIFGGAYFTKKWQAFLIPLLATFLSDLFINNVIYAAYNPSFVWFYEGFYWQYGAYIAIVAAGLLIFHRRVTVANTLVAALTSTALFFLISNFGVWYGSSAYPQTFTGLIACYTSAIPFIQGTLLGDLFYSAVLFGSFELFSRRFLAPLPQAA